jgi:hypothetical protein
MIALFCSILCCTRQDKKASSRVTAMKTFRSNRLSYSYSTVVVSVKYTRLCILDGAVQTIA